MAKNTITIKKPATTVKQIIADFDRNSLQYQVELFVNNGGTIKQLEGFQRKPLNINPCGWTRANYEQ